MPSMIGNFAGNGVVLHTDKLVGNINACIGFVKNKESNIYIPNTALKEDIRNITKDRKNVIMVVRKNTNEKLYSNVTYLKPSYEIYNILNTQSVKNKIDVNNINTIK